MGVGSNILSKIKKINKKNKKVIIVTMISILVLITLISTSFAMFFTNASSNNKDLIKTGDLSVTFNDSMGSAININPARPVSDVYGKQTEPYKFTITNNGDYIATYNIVLENEIITNQSGLSNNEVKSNIKYQMNNNMGILSTLPNGNILYTGCINKGETINFELRLWVKEEATIEMEGATYQARVAVSGKAVNKCEIYEDESGANAPVLASGMIPVIYDESIDSWVKADTKKEWYNYGRQMWANAVTVKDCQKKGDINQDGVIDETDSDLVLRYFLGNCGNYDYCEEEVMLERGDIDGDGEITNRDATFILQNITDSSASYPLCNPKVPMNREDYQNAVAGTSISMDDINSMWVWIPRYKYKIPSNIGSSSNVTTPPQIDVVFESGTNATGVSINTSGVANTQYYTHPAFRNGRSVYKSTAYDQGGWDEELTGFWAAKFETGGTITTANSSTVTASLLVKPNISSISNKQMVEHYYAINSMVKTGNLYGFNGDIDTHMMKNTEWGAVAYLSQSKYGKNGNAEYTGANKEIYKNNVSYTGGSGGSPSAGISTNEDFVEYEYNVSNKGTGASTTGTIYGIYDMSGGRWEAVMGNKQGMVGDSGFTSSWMNDANNKKYYDKYNGISAINNKILGDATWETSRWYNDGAYFFSDDSLWNPNRAWFVRGGQAEDLSDSGIFKYDPYYSNFASRIVLIP